MESKQLNRDSSKALGVDPAKTTPKLDADEPQILEKTSFYQQEGILKRSYISQCDEASSADSQPLDLIDFLAVSQWRQIEFFPIAWQQTLPSIGVGGTARMKQSLVSLDVSLAFKQLHLEKATTSGRLAALRTSMAEVGVLGHPIIREHPNIIRLEGICWDFIENEVWPVLVFKKADHGNLRNFLLSDAGNHLSFEQKLQICTEIGSAVMTMHAFHLVHGDLKPENIVLFNDKNGGFNARVVDFGYSGLSLERSEDSKFHLPISQPWNAPEVTEWDSTLPFSAARSADVYSFGMLCLWILFRNHFPTPLDVGDSLAETDSDLLRNLKDNDLLFAFAMECAENDEGLTEEQRDGLALFFSWTLATDSLARQLPRECHEAAENMFLEQRNSVSPPTEKQETATKVKPVTLTSLGILYTDIEGHQRPFGYLHYYSSHLDLGYNTDHSTFKLTDTIPHFVISDYRLWIYLKRCYKARYDDDSRDSDSRVDAAFQLALLNELGLNVSNKDGEISEDWLFKSGKSKKDLDFEIDKIKEVKRVSFRSLDIPLDAIDYVEEFRQAGILEEAQKVYESTANELRLLLGNTHPLVVRLILMSAKELHGLGDLRRAEEVLVNQITANQTAQLNESADAIAAQICLVSVYLDRFKLWEAKQLQLTVLETSTRVFGEESQQALTSMGNLAVMYWNLHDFGEAEKILSQQLDVLKRSRGKRHKKTLTVMNNLASTYEYQNRSEDAAQMKLEALALSSELNGKDHHYTLALMSNVANNYRKRKQFSKAEELEVQVVQVRKQQLGENHPTTLLAIANLASSYALQGRAREAEPLEKHVASSFGAQFGAQHPHTLTARNNLAHTLKDLGQLDEAIEMMTDVVMGRTEILGPRHPETEKSARNLQLWHDMVSVQRPTTTPGQPDPQQFL